MDFRLRMVHDFLDVFGNYWGGRVGSVCVWFRQLGLVLCPVPRGEAEREEEESEDDKRADEDSDDYPESETEY